MKFERKLLTDLHRCYAVADTKIDGKTWLLYATEGQGPCLMFDPGDLSQSTVWDGPGGTMSMIPVPGKNGDFLAVQNFFPTFDSAKATIVWASPRGSRAWEVRELLALPYVHRFDILTAGGVNYFLGSVLCNSKQFKDDWSDPGKVYAGELGDDAGAPVPLSVIKDGLTKNHGYSRVTWNGAACGIVTAEEGAFLITPPQRRGGEWSVEQLLDRPVSDIAAVDIDGDGEDELVTIEPFHGDGFLINKRIDKVWKPVYSYPKKMDFGHVVWGGTLRGKPCVLGGYRREGKELFMVTCSDPKRLVFHTETVARGNGPSNIHVIHGADRDMILAADRESGQAAIYYVTD